MILNAVDPFISLHIFPILLLGGYVAQARADFVQGIVMMFGVALLIFFVLRSEQVDGFADSHARHPELLGQFFLSW